MDRKIHAVIGTLFLLAQLLSVSTEEVEHHVVIKLDYSGVRGDSVAGVKPGASWAPPINFSSPGKGWLCTKSSFPNQDAYCAFSHGYGNITWTNIFVNTTHGSAEDAECVTQFDRVDPHGDFGVAEETVTFAHNATVCYSTKGVRFINTDLYFVRHSVEIGKVDALPDVDGLKFAMGDVNYIMIEDIENFKCLEWLIYRSEKIDGQQVDEDDVQVDDGAVYFPREKALGVCSIVRGRKTVVQNCRLDSRGRCRPGK